MNFIKNFNTIREDLPKKIGPFTCEHIVERNEGHTLYFHYCNESFGGLRVVIEARSEFRAIYAHVANPDRTVAYSETICYCSYLDPNINNVFKKINELVLLELYAIV